MSKLALLLVLAMSSQAFAHYTQTPEELGIVEPNMLRFVLYDARVEHLASFKLHGLGHVSREWILKSGFTAAEVAVMQKARTRADRARVAAYLERTAAKGLAAAFELLYADHDLALELILEYEKPASSSCGSLLRPRATCTDS